MRYMVYSKFNLASADSFPFFPSLFQLFHKIKNKTKSTIKSTSNVNNIYIDYVLMNALSLFCYEIQTDYNINRPVLFYYNI